MADRLTTDGNEGSQKSYISINLFCIKPTFFPRLPATVYSPVTAASTAATATTTTTTGTAAATHATSSKHSRLVSIFSTSPFLSIYLFMYLYYIYLGTYSGGGA